MDIIFMHFKMHLVLSNY